MSIYVYFKLIVRCLEHKSFLSFALRISFALTYSLGLLSAFFFSRTCFITSLIGMTWLTNGECSATCIARISSASYLTEDKASSWSSSSIAIKWLDFPLYKKLPAYAKPLFRILSLIWLGYILHGSSTTKGKSLTSSESLGSSEQVNHESDSTLRGVLARTGYLFW